MDSYVAMGTVLALLASAVLFLREPKKKQDKLADEMLRIGEQMKMYKESSTADNASTASAKARAMSVDDDPNFPGGRVAILFGSQTGTAEGFAEVLKKGGRKAGFAAHALDLEDYDAAAKLATEKCVILVMATYGEGDPTDNAVEFLKFLKDGGLADDALAGVGYTVFGLGNRQYEHYNAMGRQMDKLMAEHGAHRVFNYGEGDDDASLDEDFDDWKETLWKELRAQFVAGAADAQADSATAVAVEGSETLSPPEYEYKCEEIRAAQAEALASSQSIKDAKMKASTKHFFTAASAKVVVNRELRPSTENGSTVHVEMDLRDTGVEYQTADNLAILPDNELAVVERLASRLGYDLEQWLAIRPVDVDSASELPFPSPCTVQQLLTRYLGINGAPRKGPLKQLAYFATDASEREELVLLASKEGKDKYQSWVLDDERSFVDVLEHFRSVQVPVQALMHLVPYLAPRYYTISSSSLVNPQRVHVTVSLIEKKQRDGRVFRGVCSNYLGELQPLDSHDDAKKKRESRPGEQGTKAPRVWPAARVFVRASTFRLPKNPLTPIILIGPGTGIAPMRAFLHERAAQKASGVEVGPSILYFGCRRRDEDFIYRDELEEFQDSGVLSEMYLAFSREQKDKVYVQHLLQQQGEAMWTLIRDQDAHIYVCGATTMGNDVHKVLRQVIEEFGGQSAGEATATLKGLQDTHRYVQELWA